LTKWELTKWEVDQMGIDEVGIDKVGIDKVGITHPANSLHHWQIGTFLMIYSASKIASGESSPGW